MAKVLYVWCDCGSPGGPRHFYRGEKCPFSGWVAPCVCEATEAAIAVEQAGAPLSVEALRRAGLSRKALARVMIAEFASVSDSPEVLGIGSSGVNLEES